MSDNEQTISPEEKLLKVIKGETPATPAAAPVQAARPPAAPGPAPVKPPAPPVQSVPRPVPPPKPAEVPKPPAVAPRAAAGLPKTAPKPGAEAPKAPPAAPAGEKPKLKLAKPDAAETKTPPAGKAPAKEEAPAAAAAAPASVPAQATVVSAKKRSEVKQFGVLKINFGLAAAVLIIVAFSVNEIFAKLKTDTDLHKPPVVGTSVGQSGTVPTGTGSQLPPWDKIMEFLGDRPIVAPPGPRPPDDSGKTGTGGGGTTVQVADWMKYVQDNFKLLGFSGDTLSSAQAIVQDKEGKLNYLKTGEKLSLPGYEIQIEAIKDDQVFLTDGRRKMTLK